MLCIKLPFTIFLSEVTRQCWTPQNALCSSAKNNTRADLTACCLLCTKSAKNSAIDDLTACWLLCMKSALALFLLSWFLLNLVLFINGQCLSCQQCFLILMYGMCFALCCIKAAAAGVVQFSCVFFVAGLLTSGHYENLTMLIYNCYIYNEYVFLHIILLNMSRGANIFNMWLQSLLLLFFCQHFIL